MTPAETPAETPADTSRSEAQPAASNRLEGQPQAWLHARARLMPRLLIQAPPWVRGVFDHAWAPMEALARQVSCLPPSLLDFLLTCTGGYVAICAGESRYVAGAAPLRPEQVSNVAFVSVEDLAADNERPLHVIGHLVDHHLGCAGEPNAVWLSEGGGVIPGWHEAGARLLRIFALEYGVDEIAQSNSREYLAQSLAHYCRDRRRLNVADPQICKWFRSTLWNESFWQRKT
ncbi:hypothetical protein ACFLYD_00715 [Chloroflexota bacterium]